MVVVRRAEHAAAVARLGLRARRGLRHQAHRRGLGQHARGHRAAVLAHVHLGEDRSMGLHDALRQAGRAARVPVGGMEVTYVTGLPVVGMVVTGVPVGGMDVTGVPVGGMDVTDVPVGGIDVR